MEWPLSYRLLSTRIHRDTGRRVILISGQDNGVIQGDGGYFRPDDAITRGEVAQLTQNLIGYVNKATNTFTDVAASDWYSDAILRLVEAGVLTGNGDGTMSPNNYMTREEAMTMLARQVWTSGAELKCRNNSICRLSKYF